jgi:hypothetical protein
MVSNEKMIIGDKLEMEYKMVIPYFKVLSQNFPGTTEESI